MSFEFKDIHVADVEKDINLKTKGETDGKNNLPSENSEVFSITRHFYKAMNRICKPIRILVKDLANCKTI